MGTVQVDAQQVMAVGARARAAATGLDPEEVVEDGYDEVVVEVAAAGGPHHERHDGQPFGVEVTEDFDVRLVLPGRDRAAQVVLLVGADHLDADRLFELEYQAGPDRFDDGRCAALLTLGGVFQVAVRGRIDVGDGAAAGHSGTRLRSNSRRSTRTPGVLGPPMNLCGLRKIASL